MLFQSITPQDLTPRNQPSTGYLLQSLDTLRQLTNKVSIRTEQLNNVVYQISSSHIELQQLNLPTTLILTVYESPHWQIVHCSSLLQRRLTTSSASTGATYTPFRSRMFVSLSTGSSYHST
jgi:hypothetical protein